MARKRKLNAAGCGSVEAGAGGFDEPDTKREEEPRRKKRRKSSDDEAESDCANDLEVARAEIERLRREKRLAEKTAEVERLRMEKRMAEMEAAHSAEVERLRLEKRMALELKDVEHKLEMKEAEHRIALLERGRKRGGGKSKENAEDQPSERSRDRRLRRLPWLKKVDFGRLPEAILGKLFGYLDDNQLFEIRGLCSSAYFAFYHQEPTCLFDGKDVNFFRMIRLARKGRVFKRVRFLWYKNSLNTNHLPPLRDADLRAITCRSFPNLKALAFFENALEISSLTSLPPNPLLEGLGCNLPPERSGEVAHVNGQRFPSLQALYLSVEKLSIR